HDLAGNIYITGTFGSSLTIGSTTLTNTGGIFSDVFVAKYDNSGNVIWAKSAGGTSSEGGRAIIVDGSGNSYVTGIFESSTISFGSTTLTNGASIDAFVVKYDSAGNVLWAANAGGNGIAFDAYENIYLTGSKTAKYDPAGNLVWISLGGKGGTDIAVDGSGYSYITGSFDGTFTFGNTTLTTTGSEDVFVAKLDNYSPVGIEEIFRDNFVTVFPNPVKDQLHLHNETNNIGLVCLYDSFGRKILEKNVKQKHAEIDMVHLNAGIYLLKTAEGAVSVVKE
ncbi:MAG: T9SS type A sorting domain-containing protein, partial [Bacteroidia bacterium]